MTNPDKTISNLPKEGALPKTQSIKKTQNINHWLQTFGKPPGHKVLKEIRDYAEYPDVDSADIAYGKKQMMELFIV